MYYLIEHSQAAALERVLKKIKAATRPEQIIPVTAKEMEAYKAKIHVWDQSDTADLNALLEDVPEPEPKKKVIRLMWREKGNPSHWEADKWVLDVPEYRALLERRVEAYNNGQSLESAIEWIYSIDEREVQDGEQY